MEEAVHIQTYINLVWLFVCIGTVLMIVLCYVYLSMRHAQERESQSLTFSLQAIEAMEAERCRVSRELHDTVLPLVRDKTISGLIRQVCAALMPPDFSRISFKDSLAALCDDFSARTEIECAFSIEDSLDFSAVSPEHQLHLYRMVQESLTNIEKHSGAKKAVVVARRKTRGSEENILICVSDDGVGIRGANGIRGTQGGLGMKTMRQRAAILGAKLDFVSEDGNGLMVRIEQVTPPPPQVTGLEPIDG